MLENCQCSNNRFWKIVKTLQCYTTLPVSLSSNYESLWVLEIHAMSVPQLSCWKALAASVPGEWSSLCLDCRCPHTLRVFHRGPFDTDIFRPLPLLLTAMLVDGFSFPSWPNLPLAAVKVSCCEESSSVLWEKKLSWLRKDRTVASVRELHVAHWSSKGWWLRCSRNWNSERNYMAYIDGSVKSWKDGFNLIVVFLPFLASVSPCLFVLWSCFGVWEWFCFLRIKTVLEVSFSLDKRFQTCSSWIFSLFYRSSAIHLAFK